MTADKCNGRYCHQYQDSFSHYTRFLNNKDTRFLIDAKTYIVMRMKKVQFLKKLYLRVINNRQSLPAQILLTDCVSCLNSGVRHIVLGDFCDEQGTDEQGTGSVHPSV